MLLTNLAEPAVNFALRELVSSGDTVFDLGANVGGLTTVMSRLVGPHGTVIAFEANDAVLPQIRAALSGQNCRNVWLEETAVSARDGELTFETHPDHPYGGKIAADGREDDQQLASSGFAFNRVYARSLDSFCSEHNLRPTLIKMDIEGGELSALDGAREIIRRFRPIFILEQHAQCAPACISFLDEHSYGGIDLKALTPVDRHRSWEAGEVTDVLYFPEEKKKDLPRHYASPARARVAEVSSIAPGSLETEDVSVPPGRYIVELLWDFQGTIFLSQEIMVDGQTFSRADAPVAAWIHQNYRSVSVSLPRGGRIKGLVRVSNPETVRFKGLQIDEILPKRDFRPGAWF